MTAGVKSHREHSGFIVALCWVKNKQIEQFIKYLNAFHNGTMKKTILFCISTIHSINISEYSLHNYCLQLLICVWVFFLLAFLILITFLFFFIFLLVYITQGVFVEKGKIVFIVNFFDIFIKGKESTFFGLSFWFVLIAAIYLNTKQISQAPILLCCKTANYYYF